MATNSGLFRGWRVVAGSGIGIAFGSVVFTGGGFAQLAHAWGHEFGWTQPQLAKAATIYLLLQTVTFPVLGWLLDRWGSRKVASASIVLFTLALLALSRIGDSLNQLYAAFALIGLVSGGTNVVSYARALSLWFDRQRGLALGLAAGSQAIGAVLLPILGAKIIATAGWSAALSSLAAFELVVCLPLVALLVRDSPAPYGLLPDGAASAGPAAPAKALVIGLSRGAVLRSPTFWKLALAFAVMGLTFYAISINIVFILSKTAGLAPAEIAKIQAIAGAAVLIGRIGFGWLLDRLHAPRVGMLTLAMGAVGLALYATTTAPTLILFAALLGGAAIGGEADLMPYLASRYFGTRSLSSVFGWFLTAFFVGAAIGPIAFATIATSQNSVVLPLYLLIALHIVPMLAFVTLGRYPSVADLAEANGKVPDLENDISHSKEKDGLAHS